MSLDRTSRGIGISLGVPVEASEHHPCTRKKYLKYIFAICSARLQVRVLAAYFPCVVLVSVVFRTESPPSLLNSLLLASAYCSSLGLLLAHFCLRFALFSVEPLLGTALGSVSVIAEPKASAVCTEE